MPDSIVAHNDQERAFLAHLLAIASAVLGGDVPYALEVGQLAQYHANQFPDSALAVLKQSAAFMESLPPNIGETVYGQLDSHTKEV